MVHFILDCVLASSKMLRKKRSKENKIENKIYCANCSHCIVFKKPIAKGRRYVLRVRCNAGMWRKRSGEEKIYKYFTILRRKREACQFYDPMGDEKTFIKELKKNLPVEDKIYNYDTI